MSDSPTFLESELRRSNVHSAVQLHRISVDHLGALTSLGECRRKVEGQPRLTGARGPNYRDQMGLVLAVQR